MESIKHTRPEPAEKERKSLKNLKLTAIFNEIAFEQKKINK